MRRLAASIALLGLLLAQSAAADLHEMRQPDGFRATCEDLGSFCFADACGGDQIDAARACRARCPSAAILSVVPAACPRTGGPVVLRSRG
ncbi:hypothetical protein [Methylobacterium sp. J-070]|uniref:hypothetical protein n=1 Tax=Methylobacterium sp. J-070 TaxID=2836650 RepID=UPI001FBAED52|nr:hypothetical protein [Methylobacterium sp. J-070]MCJ2049891.1 hypothetical protein [Methylobacterium sp. J-070]